MPRNVRNFWITADIDGRRSPFASGPVRKDGGFDLTIKIRDGGNVVRALDIIGRADEDGDLRLIVTPAKSGIVHAEGGVFAWDSASEVQIRGTR